MKTFAVERNLRGLSMNDLADAQKLAIATADSLTDAGRTIAYLRSVFVPEDGRCTCLFAAENEDTVRQLNERAQLPFTKIVEVLDLQPA